MPNQVQQNVPSGPAFPLAFANRGERVVVVDVHGPPGIVRRAISMGLHPGAEVVVLSAGRPGPFLVAVRDTRIALGFGLARRVLVRPVSASLGLG